jgi:protoheme IX farnesyltransferase
VLDRIKILFELTKIRITSFVTVTTFLGYVLYSHSIQAEILTTLIGTLLLACGSAVFNHYQERKYDSIMQRTLKRPIPSGRISPKQTLLIGTILSLAGAFILLIGIGLIPFILGIIALIWYNLIYTPMKRINPFAAVPGSLIGAIPPMIGWTAAGGYIFDSQILIVAFFFFIWQIPHFWLLMLFFDQDYKRAGFPTLSSIFSSEQISRITFIWMMAIAVVCIGLPLFRIVNSHLINFGLVLTAVRLGWHAVKLLIYSKDNLNLIYAFRGINTFALIVIILLSVDNLLLK